MTFELIVQRLSPTLKKITRKLNGHHSFFDNDDLYQEALIHLWGTYKKGIIVDKTDSYILQGCYYHLRNYLRTVHEKASFLSLNDPAGEDGRSLEEMVSSSDMTVLDYLEGKLQADAVMSRISFTEREYAVLNLLLEGMTVREAGSQLGISHVMVVKIKNKICRKYVESSAFSAVQQAQSPGKGNDTPEAHLIAV